MDENGVRMDEYLMMGGRRTTGLGRIVQFSKPFEPVSGLAEAAVVTVVSESTETLTLAGKNDACTKIQRKINQPLNDYSNRQNRCPGMDPLTHRLPVLYSPQDRWYSAYEASAPDPGRNRTFHRIAGCLCAAGPVC